MGVSPGEKQCTATLFTFKPNNVENFTAIGQTVLIQSQISKLSKFSLTLLEAVRITDNTINLGIMKQIWTLQGLPRFLQS